jgi:hypothetical protein
MSIQEYDYIAVGWAIILVLLALFWYATLRKLTEILNERLKSIHSNQSISGIPGAFQFLIRGEFKQTGDERLVTVCRRLRQLLYGYLGGIGAYVVFIVIFRPHH